MKWIDLKADIEEDIFKRNLAASEVRINAIKSIEDLLNKLIVSFLENPNELCAVIEKNKLKTLLAELHENKTLNGAQETVVNEVYYRLQA